MCIFHQPVIVPASVVGRDRGVVVVVVVVLHNHSLANWVVHTTVYVVYDQPSQCVLHDRRSFGISNFDRSMRWTIH